MIKMSAELSWNFSWKAFTIGQILQGWHNFSITGQRIIFWCCRVSTTESCGLNFFPLPQNLSPPGTSKRLRNLAHAHVKPHRPADHPNPRLSHFFSPQPARVWKLLKTRAPIRVFFPPRSGVFESIWVARFHYEKSRQICVFFKIKFWQLVNLTA